MSDAASAAAAFMPPDPSLQAGYGASFGSGPQFADALHAAQAGQANGLAGASPTGGLDAIQPALKGMMSTLEHVNGEATQLAQFAQDAKMKGASLTPGEMVMMTVRCQEFMFHCQLTSNIANRTSDGVQQLFRQQG
jgi:hypothetical protein